MVVGLYQPLADDGARTTLVMQATSDHASSSAVASEDKEEKTVGQSALLRLREDWGYFSQINVLRLSCCPGTPSAALTSAVSVARGKALRASYPRRPRAPPSRHTEHPANSERPSADPRTNVALQGRGRRKLAGAWGMKPDGLRRLRPCTADAQFCGPATLMHRSRASLLDFDLRAGFLELLLRGFGVRLRDAFLDGLRRAVDQVLRFLEAEARQLAHGLDHVHLVLAERGEDDGELGLFLGGGGGAAAAAGPATATAAAAETPNLSSIALMSSESSRTVNDEILSRISV